MANERIRSVGIVVKPGHDEAMATAAELSAWLATKDIACTGEPVSALDGEEEKLADAELIVVLGGDGTMIATARMIGERDVPVLGINYGGLGYLAEFRIEELYTALESILAGNYRLDRRVMLAVEHCHGDDPPKTNRVLNDVVINKSALA